MNDPQRLIRRGPGELEHELVASMLGDAPSAATRARALAAFGLGGALSATASATAAATVTAKASLPSTLALWLIAGAGVSVLAAGVAHQAGWAFGGPAHRADVARSAGEHASSARIVPTAPGKPVLVATPTAAFDDGEPPPSSRPTAGTRVHGTEVRSPPDAQLAEEVRALDQARQAALAHDPERALRLVAAYQALFPGGKLGPEATVLRVEALIATGNKAAAASLAQSFLQSDPSGPLAERVRTLLGEATQPY
jgi:hypothetical protein